MYTSKLCHCKRSVNNCPQCQNVYSNLQTSNNFYVSPVKSNPCNVQIHNSLFILNTASGNSARCSKKNALSLSSFFKGLDCDHKNRSDNILGINKKQSWWWGIESWVHFFFSKLSFYETKEILLIKADSVLLRKLWNRIIRWTSHPWALWITGQ